MKLLKASIANLLSNRALLRQRYANLEIDSEPVPSANGMNSLDWKFISEVKKNIERISIILIFALTNFVNYRA